MPAPMTLDEVRLAASPDASPRWVGKDALRELANPNVQARLR